VSKKVDEFNAYRDRMNERILNLDNLDVRRFFALDDRVYKEGALPTATKELMGLVASLVLRCDDCIAYHVIRCHETGFTVKQLTEALSVGLVVGGSIVVPHLRRAVDLMDEIWADDPDDDTAVAPGSGAG
jgi:AhpD family alkylhydroperoxidase